MTDEQAAEGTREADPSTKTSKPNGSGLTIILGVNDRIGSLIEMLKEQKRELVVVSEHVKNAAVHLDGVKTILGDFTDEINLRKAGITEAEAVIILAETFNHKSRDADARSVVATLLVESIKPEIRTVVEALNDDTAFHLRNAGVDEIIVSGELTADILAFSTSHHNYSSHLEILLRFAHKNKIVTAPVRDRLIGKIFSQASRVLIAERKIPLGVRPKDKDREVLDPTRVLRDGDTLVYIDIL